MKFPRRYALVIANGSVPRRELCRTLAKDASLIVCADGGANKALERGIRPHVIVGDLDSVKRSTLKALRTSQIVLNVNQEATDLEKALDYLISKRLRKVLVLGATGRRTDHTLTNFSILKKYSQCECRSTMAPRRQLDIRFIDDFLELRILPHRSVLTTSVGEILSLVPLGKAEGITTTGLRFPLKNESLELGLREGQSNEATARRVVITYTSGTLLLARFHHL
ncbi:MAG: thiamine diphosphokinase [Bacteroidota bacterium]